jgi:hypothetical protein
MAYKVAEIEAARITERSFQPRFVVELQFGVNSRKGGAKKPTW